MYVRDSERKICERLKSKGGAAGRESFTKVTDAACFCRTPEKATPLGI